MERLKSCPFCGKPVCMKYSSRNSVFQFFHVEDDDAWTCVVSEPINLKASPFVQVASLADAAGAWNRRINEDAN